MGGYKKIRIFLLTIPLLLISVSRASPEKAVKNLLIELPKKIDSWISRADDSIFTRSTLFNHINGGAEPYLTYDFREAAVRRYSGNGNDEILVEVYDMGKAIDAYGIFSIENADEEIGIGQGSEYGGGLLRFWKNSYFISIMTTGDEKTAAPVMKKIAKILESKIDSTGDKPDSVSSLPQLSERGFNLKKTRFFHQFSILNRLYYLADENILKLGRNTDCLLAMYEHGGSRIYLLMARYLSIKEAEEAYALFIKSYMPDSAGQGKIKTENGKWVMSRKEGESIYIVFDAPDKNRGMEILNGIKRKKE